MNVHYCEEQFAYVVSFGQARLLLRPDELRLLLDLGEICYGTHTDVQERYRKAREDNERWRNKQ